MNVANNNVILPYQSRKYNMLKIQPPLVKPRIMPKPPEMEMVRAEDLEKGDPFAAGLTSPSNPPVPSIRLDDEGDMNTLRTINALA